MIRFPTRNGVLEAIESFLALDSRVVSCCLGRPHFESTNDELFLVLRERAAPLAILRQAAMTAAAGLEHIDCSVLSSTERVTKFQMVSVDTCILEALRHAMGRLRHLCVDTVRVLSNTTNNHSNDVAAKLFDLVVAGDPVEVPGGLEIDWTGSSCAPLVQVKDVVVRANGVTILNSARARLFAVRPRDTLRVHLDLAPSKSCVINCWYGHRLRYEHVAEALAGLEPPFRRALYDDLVAIEPTAFEWCPGTQTFTCPGHPLPLSNATRILTAQQRAKKIAGDPDFVRFTISREVCDFFIETNGEVSGASILREAVSFVTRSLSDFAEEVALASPAGGVADRSHMPHALTASI